MKIAQASTGLLALFMAATGWPSQGKPSYAKASEGRPNHLINEKSPYLLQHAYNPVDWYPWGEAAFQKAKRENKPIFLSIGYSTCHWCHVMERESFSNPKIAAIMNKHFVSIKVDREERPDVDKIYMTAVSAMTGGGGWPLSAWLTPDLKPFYGGTYFPPDARWGRPGFPQILERMAEAWEKERSKVITSSNQASQTIQRYMTVSGRSGPLEPAALESGVASFQKSYDATHGGFRGAPKFPMPVIHNFLLRYHARSGQKKALEMSFTTLRAMARGGIYDHVGGGFHRYSTDAVWHIPHFEKMLYDNAQLAVNYVEAFQITKDPELARVARETLEYVRRDMTHPQGGFYSAEDADSLPPELAGKVPDKGHEHKAEGAFYVWEEKELLAALGPETGELYSYHYGVNPGGNASSDPHGEFKNKNILYAAHTISKTARQFKMSESQVKTLLEEARRKLLAIRSIRPRPHLDDKILVSWNGLMISAFARAAQVFDDPSYLESARKAASFIRTNLYDPKNRTLHRRWREGEKKIPGIADDYAFLAQGLIDLYEASFDVRWLEWAIELAETQNRLFYDRENGGFYMTAEGHDRNLLVRTKEDSDNVEPAASSVAALNLLRLAQFTDREDSTHNGRTPAVWRFRQAAEKTLTLFGKQLSQDPASLAQMLVALDYALSKPKQIVIAGDLNAKDTRAMLRLVHDRLIPGKILLLADGGKGQETLARRLPFLNGITRKQNKATVYVCIDYACELPTNDPTILARILSSKMGSKR